MTLAVNFIVNNCFVFKLELMESFGSTQYDGAIGSVLLDANTISLYRKEIILHRFISCCTGYNCNVFAPLNAK